MKQPRKHKMARYNKEPNKYGFGGIIGAIGTALKGAKGAQAAGQAAKAAGTASKASKALGNAQKYMKVAKSMGGGNSQSTQETAHAMRPNQPGINDEVAQSPQVLAWDSGNLRPRRYRAGTGYYRNTENYTKQQVYNDKSPTLAKKEAVLGQKLKNAPMMGQIGKSILGKAISNKTPNTGAKEGDGVTIGGSDNKAAPVKSEGGYRYQDPGKTTIKNGGVSPRNYFTKMTPDQVVNRQANEGKIQADAETAKEKQESANRRYQLDNLKNQEVPVELEVEDGENKGGMINVKTNPNNNAFDVTGGGLNTKLAPTDLNKVADFGSNLMKRKGSRYVKPVNKKRASAVKGRKRYT